MKPFIGISQIWYGDPLTTAPTLAGLAALVQNMTEVKNSHDGTWSYEQDDPETTEYINELTGQTYYIDRTSNGKRTINFTMGVYEFEDKVALEGGEKITESTKTVGWKSNSDLLNINKAIVAKTKTGNYIIFSNASVVGKGDVQEKNIGLGVTATAMESDSANVEAVYMFDGSAISSSNG